jgi:hypothetical protein
MGFHLVTGRNCLFLEEEALLDTNRNRKQEVPLPPPALLEGSSTPVGRV